jgi:hypothetical protein
MHGYGGLLQDITEIVKHETAAKSRKVDKQGKTSKKHHYQCGVVFFMYHDFTLSSGMMLCV